MEREIIDTHWPNVVAIETVTGGTNLDLSKPGFDILWQFAVRKEFMGQEIEWQPVYRALAADLLRSADALAASGIK